MTNEEREKHIRIASMLIGAIHDLIRPMLMYQIEKDVAKEALENYIKMLEQQPCDDCISRKAAKVSIQRKIDEVVSKDGSYDYDMKQYIGGLLTAKIAISRNKLPSVTPTISKMEQVEDCISREAVLDELDKYIDKAQSTGTRDDFISFQELVVKQLPSVTPSIPDVENDFNLGYNCGYADAMNDIAESEE